MDLGFLFQVLWEAHWKVWPSNMTTGPAWGLVCFTLPFSLLFSTWYCFSQFLKWRFSTQHTASVASCAWRLSSSSPHQPCLWVSLTQQSNSPIRSSPSESFLWSQDENSHFGYGLSQSGSFSTFHCVIVISWFSDTSASPHKAISSSVQVLCLFLLNVFSTMLNTASTQ